MKKHIIYPSYCAWASPEACWHRALHPIHCYLYSKLHGQTRKYEMSFREKQDSICLYWGIERNLKWQSGSYTMGPKSTEQAVQLSFLQPEDGSTYSSLRRKRFTSFPAPPINS